MENQENTSGKQNINIQVPSAENIASRRSLIPVLFAAVIIFFFFNFFTVSYGRQEVVSVLYTKYNPFGGDKIKIGNQVWMAKNLAVDKFRNGDAIPEAKTKQEWEEYGDAGKAAWCYYDNDPSNGEKYGKLYNWYAVSDPRGLAPDGWHIPSDAEWTKLTDYLGSAAGNKMKSTSGWNKNGNGTNESAFTGLPCGFRYNNGNFSLIGYLGFWWSSPEGDTNYAWYLYLDYKLGNVTRYYSNKGSGCSVRCLGD